MLHPAVVAAIAFTGAVYVSWKIYEEYQERKMYEQYQKHRARYEQESSYGRQYSGFRRNNNEFDFDDDNEEITSNIRKRKPFSGTSSTEKKKSVEEGQEQYELSDLESSIAERKRRLMAEQAFLDQEEENLRNRRNTIMRNSTKVIPMSNSRSIISNNNSSSSGNSSNSEDDEQSRKANFDPFVDQFQNNSSSDHTSVKYNEAEGEESNSDSTETIHLENNQSQVSINNSAELFYPSASLLSPSTSTTTSISGENITSPNINRSSDSEESWDAVSEIEWNQSSANESDNEFCVASISEDDTRIRF